MKDIKVLRYYSPVAGADFVELGKVGQCAKVQENKAIEAMLLPYLNDGYQIVQFVGDMNNCVILLQKN